jgi:hypothetical protein
VRESERLKLKKLMDIGKTNEEILEALKPNRRGDGHEVPEGGISQSEPSQKYDVAQTTISGWVLKGYVPALLRTSKEVYIDEAILAEVIECYKSSPGQGRKTVKQQFSS